MYIFFQQRDQVPFQEPAADCSLLFTQHSLPSVLSAGKSLGTEELNISEFSLESSVSASGMGLLASTYGIGAGPGTGLRSSRLTCTQLRQKPQNSHCK